MIRTIAGYAFFGIIGVIAFKLLLGVVGLVFSLLWTLVSLAAIGFLFYLILRLVNPGAARRMRDKVSGAASEDR